MIPFKNFRFIMITGCLAAAGTLMLGHAALAQSGIMNNGIGAATGPVVGTATLKGPKAPSPPALPGTHPERAEAAPAGKTVMDMQPTDALFDAINRGDTPAARDALNRGADLHGHNVLGMTPTELSVDLARNDITFLLLSMRGPGDNGAGAGLATRGASRTAEAKPVKASVRATRIVTAAPSPRAPRAPVVDTSRQYASGPGTPIPQAGFLGFGITR